ncbi:hypothetical protein BJ138DRAFT_879007 [Hygrophoropsis aurantiaca]|uniref:Uncharacterized protein n=1 Tax=Hygrophoropsis aurantiaca TaxID=72124 RepID=A0ACB8AST0_9AGAM|nr:hypothetical protein BJ138DRAFT_879007 [Hygrophoropsis aurantiaca]
MYGRSRSDLALILPSQSPDRRNSLPSFDKTDEDPSETPTNLSLRRQHRRSLAQALIIPHSARTARGLELHRREFASSSEVHVHEGVECPSSTSVLRLAFLDPKSISSFDGSAQFKMRTIHLTAHLHGLHVNFDSSYFSITILLPSRAAASINGHQKSRTTPVAFGCCYRCGPTLASKSNVMRGRDKRFRCWSWLWEQACTCCSVVDSIWLVYHISGIKDTSLESVAGLNSMYQCSHRKQTVRLNHARRHIHTART